MSNDNTSGPSNDRRGSVTSAAFSNLFQKSNSTSTANGNGRESIMSAAVRDQRRRLSVTTIGLSGTSPNSGNSAFGIRRGSISTNNSDSIDESAIDDEESAKIGPNSPFVRRISFGAQAMRTLRTGPGSPGTTDSGYNWSEQLRTRAESSVQGHRPTFGPHRYGSPPHGSGQHDRSKSVSEMPVPPQQAAAVKLKQPERPKPDHMQERILKGDFYMD
ncbi:uncharacterized protein F4812DRAFT_306497 [Daldinia caldariorum]|uniref:uncharacterized protein n=1 Tax=Daldinia caldariorum TaxID=326644 RepID=UPI0020072973|nr:uncharacterized protein F4812DRAFT_306497 [Daldinia caldariorum]KAI1469908.1 hypothetical protein F4812DRAFT_306497 [Daldinia caldariorum]